jgi:hypothetical protein
MKKDVEALELIKKALLDYTRRECEKLAAQVYLQRRGGEAFEAANPGKEHAWFDWADDYESKLNKLQETGKVAAEFLDSLDPFK